MNASTPRRWGPFLLSKLSSFAAIFSSEDFPIVLQAKGSDRNNEGFLETRAMFEPLTSLTPRGGYGSRSQDPGTDRHDDQDHFDRDLRIGSSSLRWFYDGNGKGDVLGHEPMSIVVEVGSSVSLTLLLLN